MYFLPPPSLVEIKVLCYGRLSSKISILKYFFEHNYFYVVHCKWGHLKFKKTKNRRMNNVIRSQLSAKTRVARKRFAAAPSYWLCLWNPMEFGFDLICRCVIRISNEFTFKNHFHQIWNYYPQKSSFCCLIEYFCIHFFHFTDIIIYVLTHHDSHSSLFQNAIT